jgi:hypothetical protein
VSADTIRERAEPLDAFCDNGRQKKKKGPLVEGLLSRHFYLREIKKRE